MSASFWGLSGKGRSSTNKQRRMSRRRSLATEGLEHRHLLATLTVDFSDLTLSPDSHFNGPDPNGTEIPGTPIVEGSFRSAWTSFNNHYDADDPENPNPFWYDFAYSNENDTTTPGLDNQFSSFAGGGLGDEN